MVSTKVERNKMNKFFVVVNNAKKDSWADWIWRDINKQAAIFLDNNTLKNNSLIWKLKRVHFSNKLNSKIRIPFKGIWNKTLCIQPNDLNEEDRNYIIFQGNVKFSPSYIKYLKSKKNTCIILYLYDTIERMGIGKNKKDFEAYCKYYHIDLVFSFDQKDVEMLNVEYFDLYSSIEANIQKQDNIPSSIFYVGSCRSKERLSLLHNLYQKCLGKIRCIFYIFGVDEKDCKYPNGINYNQGLNYSEVLKNIEQSNCILEINNADQRGFTVRFKEAVCFNKKLLTSNKEVMKSQYYNPEFIYVYDNPEDIDFEWLSSHDEIDYHYKGDFSPIVLINKIVQMDSLGLYWDGDR